MGHFFFNYVFVFNILQDEGKLNIIYNSQVQLKSRDYKEGLLISELGSSFYTSGNADRTDNFQNDDMDKSAVLM